MSEPTFSDALPNIHCAPDICEACRRWLTETNAREVEAARLDGKVQGIKEQIESHAPVCKLDMEAAREEGRREAWREAADEARKVESVCDAADLVDEFERRAGGGK